MKTYNCWKCGVEIEDGKAKWCPKCGIVQPVDGNRNLEKLRRRYRLSLKREQHCWLAALIMVFLLYTIYGDGSLFTPWGILGLCLATRVAIWAEPKARQVYSRKLSEQMVDIVKIAPGFSPAESLLRASEIPPSRQQAELLRAAGKSAHTPPEELLRAGISSERSE